MICYTKKLLFSVCLILSFSCLLAAQDNPAPNVALELSSDDDDNDKEDKKKKEEPAAKPVPSAIRPVKEKFSPAIADNSFLIEEAYNQEPGIVQHISTCMGFRKPQSDMACTFTQEWPVPNMKHQFSYTIPYSSLNANQFHGVGDVILNYRYLIRFYPEFYSCHFHYFKQFRNIVCTIYNS